MSSFSRITIDNVGYDVEDSIARNVIQDMLTAGTNIIETNTVVKSNWNTTKIYVWRGDSNASVTKGHIYYYDGTSWVDCGIYAPEGSETAQSGTYSHAEGYQTTSSGDDSHAEGYYAFTQGMGSHAEGNYTRAVGNFSHAEGTEAYALGHSSHAGGFYTKATRKAQTVIGRYNEEDTQGTDGTEYGKYAFIIGNGSDSSHRSNALAVNWNGDVECETINGINITTLNNDLQQLSNNVDKYGFSVVDGKLCVTYATA